MSERQQTDKLGNHAPATAPGQEVQKAPASAETSYVPDVDISEDAECLRLRADMPGADRESVEVTIENGVLKIEGRAKMEPPQGYQLVGQEYGIGGYRRDFAISDAVDTDHVKARVLQGVLEVTLPKHEKVKTRKVRIET